MKRGKKIDESIVSYGCGYEDKPGSFGMYAGLNPSLKAMLAEDGYGGPNACVIQFNPDGTNQVIYRWKDDRWEKVKE